RFAPGDGGASVAGSPAAGAGAGGGRHVRRRLGVLRPWAGGVGVMLAAVATALVVVISSGGFGGGSRRTGPGVSLTRPSAGLLTTAVAPAASKPHTFNAATLGAYSGLGGAQTTVAPSPVAGTTGKVIQSASVSLTTPDQHVDEVSGEVFDVVVQQHGTVQSSRITAANARNGGGYADFTLSFPTSRLQLAMTALSRLRYATVASRTDGTQNVGGRYNSDQRTLQQHQALRTSLLKQLAAATSQTQIDAIEAQLKTDDAQIQSAQKTLYALQHNISYSVVDVQINSGFPLYGSVTAATSHGFTISRAGHDAVRVLVVSVGVALIALAVLVPVGIALALIVWIVWMVRQRRRERALDAS
ncbi:MAG: DUF4349 domain-containing protein, partial [Solirubrobacteraceae bacterium]